MAISCLAEGLLPISQWALHFHVSYHEYNSLALDNKIHGLQLVNDLGNNNVLFLRNYGVILTGGTIYEAMFYTYHLEQACKRQVAALSMNKKLIIPDISTCNKAQADLINFEKDLGKRDGEAWIRLFNL